MTVVEPVVEHREELRDAVRRCLERARGPRPYLIGEPGTEEPFDAGLWRRLAAEVGVTGLIVPEELGGAGGRVADLAVVAEELGRALSPVPFFSTVALATSALLVHRDDPLARELLTRIAGDGTTATLAVGEWPRPGLEGAPVVSAEPDAGGWRLSGRCGFVVDAATAEIVLVPAATAEGPGLFAVEADASGLRRHPSRTLDLTRPMGSLAFDRVPARLVGTVAGAGQRLRAAVDIALALLAAEQVGGARYCLEQAVDYAKQRVQFNRPIGSFQAVKHTLVNVLLKVEMARSAAEIAISAADAYLGRPGDDTRHELAQAASLAKATCSDAYMYTAEETLHVHGGIGFTWEHDAHLYYRRAKATELYLGTPDQYRDRLATTAGL